MLKFVDTKIVFQEVPNEISLAINISNCPCNCPGCHSAYLAEDIGTKITEKIFHDLIDKHQGITCVLFMGGDAEPEEVNYFALISKAYNLKVAWYSGRQELSEMIELENFDYIKLGPYIEDLGPLNSKTTNQRFYEVIDGELIDKTYLFWKRK